MKQPSLFENNFYNLSWFLKLLLIVAQLALYIPIFLLIMPRLDFLAAAIGLLLVVFTGWRMGIIPGLVMGLLITLTTAVLFASGLTNEAGPSPLPALIISSVVGSSAGWGGTKLRQVQQLSAKLAVEKEALRTENQQRREAQAALRIAVKEAEAANRAKSAFLANMSHELRTPLTAIIGYSEWLQELYESDQQLNNYLQKVILSADHLRGIINNVLDLSRIEAGELVLNKEPFSLQTCLMMTLNIVSVQATEKGLALTYCIQAGTPDRLIGDEVLLRQILVNLLSNAVKFTEQGKIHLGISTTSLGKTQQEYHFTIQDTGIGIPQEYHKHIFESFSQVEESATRQHRGTGLGLAISKRLVEAMGGHIWVESETGIGTTFHFTIQVKHPANTTWLQTSGETIYDAELGFVVQTTN